MYSHVALSTQRARRVPASPSLVFHTLISLHQTASLTLSGSVWYPCRLLLGGLGVREGHPVLWPHSHEQQDCGVVPAAACLQPRFRRACDEGGPPNWQVSQPVPGHLCTVGRVFQGVVPSRGVMAVELGFLSGHMTSLGYWSHLPACAPRPARP